MSPFAGLYKYNESIYTTSAMVHLVNLQVSALWDYFCFNVSGTSAERSRGALSVLCIAAKSSTNVLSSHLQDIIDIG
ncbi:hypothetical protein Tco_0036939, partial [Tanacetum coccineum]